MDGIHIFHDTAQTRDHARTPWSPIVVTWSLQNANCSEPPGRNMRITGYVDVQMQLPAQICPVTSLKGLCLLLEHAPIKIVYPFSCITCRKVLSDNIQIQTHCCNNSTDTFSKMPPTPPPLVGLSTAHGP